MARLATNWKQPSKPREYEVVSAGWGNPQIHLYSFFFYDLLEYNPDQIRCLMKNRIS